MTRSFFSLGFLTASNLRSARPKLSDPRRQKLSDPRRQRSTVLVTNVDMCVGCQTASLVLNRAYSKSRNLGEKVCGSGTQTATGSRCGVQGFGGRYPSSFESGSSVLVWGAGFMGSLPLVVWGAGFRGSLPLVSMLGPTQSTLSDIRL